MCKWGTTKDILVTIPSEYSHTGKSFKKLSKIDSCIADIVEALETKGIVMIASCCGHNKGNGYIDLQDGRSLIIHSSNDSTSTNHSKPIK